MGFEGTYEVSMIGNVKSLPREVNRTRKGYTFAAKLKGKSSKKFLSHGYYAVSIGKENSFSPKYIHRLVAQAFIPNPNNLPCVNHKDGNKLNNHVDNLEWCTHRENTIHAHVNGLSRVPENHTRQGRNNGNSKLTEEDVKDIRRLLKSGLRIKEVAEVFPEVSKSTIGNISSGANWTHV